MEAVPVTEESKQEKRPLTREQRRAVERVNKEASEIVQRLVNSWYDFFLDNDPDSEEVKAKQREVNAKWRMYCKRRNLKPQAHNVVNQSIAGLIEEYKKEKAEV